MPSDLQTVENRLSSGHYTKLCQFVGDVMRIFENCRYFNQPNTQIMKCAEGLEGFFAQKLTLLRDKIAGDASAADSDDSDDDEDDDHATNAS